MLQNCTILPSTESCNFVWQELEDIEERAHRPGFDSGDESDDEDSGTKSSRTGRVVNGVSYEEFTVLSRR